MLRDYPDGLKAQSRQVLKQHKKSVPNSKQRLSNVSVPAYPNSCGGLALEFAQSEYRSLLSATDAIPLPEPKPRAVCELVIMPSIRSSEIACAQRSRVGHREDALQPLDFGNGLLGVHSVSISNISTATVKRDGTKCRGCGIAQRWVYAHGTTMLCIRKVTT
jgi:hypothetical protein